MKVPPVNSKFMSNPPTKCFPISAPAHHFSQVSLFRCNQLGNDEDVMERQRWRLAGSKRRGSPEKKTPRSLSLSPFSISLSFPVLFYMILFLIFLVKEGR
ncbi:unnamed protein product [Brassica rapa]|uniref:Transmembrane protein n=1 Tax=Brassica campestris TaxID=3711 RepID=A0A8D9G7G4_BRACM|nr:unnamed protein product [Brassica rapa]